MKLINRDTDYAIKALMRIARNDSGKISVSQLSRELGIPYSFLRKILQILSKEGVVHSAKGKGGGFNLAMPADQILLIDLIKIFQGTVRLNDCIFKKELCPDIKTCALHKKIAALEKNMISELQSTTLISLVEEEQLYQEKNLGKKEVAHE